MHLETSLWLHYIKQSEEVALYRTFLLLWYFLERSSHASKCCTYGWDGRVEVRELMSSHKNTKIITNCWTTTDKKNWTYRTDILHKKTKKNPQEDRRKGATTIKSNSIPTMWATHKLENNYVTEIFPQEWKFWVPCQASQHRGLAMRGWSPRASGFEGHWGLIAGIPQEWGKQ